MIALLWLLLAVLAASFKSKCRLEAENAALRHQVMVLRRQARSRMQLTNFDRLFLVQLYLCVPKTSSEDDFGFNRENSLFLNQNSLFLRKNSLFCCVGNLLPRHLRCKYPLRLLSEPLTR
jgi:hypothetical protein